MSEIELEQRMNIKFFIKLGKSRNEIRETLVQVYGDKRINRMQPVTHFIKLTCFLSHSHV